MELKVPYLARLSSDGETQSEAREKQARSLNWSLNSQRNQEASRDVGRFKSELFNLFFFSPKEGVGGSSPSGAAKV
jgi:hypothetical protein